MDITNIPAPRVPFIDERTGLMSREWYRFFVNLFILTGSGTTSVSLSDVQVDPAVSQLTAKYATLVASIDPLAFCAPYGGR